MQIAWSLLCLSASLAAAQVVPLPPSPTISPVSRDTIALTADPDRRMTVKVLLDGKGPYSFIVDTGAQRTVVSSELAAMLALRSAGPARLHSVTGSERVSLVHIETLDIDRYRSTALRAPTITAANLGAQGLIGVDSLQKQRVTLDFRSGHMTIVPAKVREPRVDDNDIIVRAKSKAGRLVIMNAMLDDERVAVILDTGSQTSLGNEALKRRLYRHERQRPSQLIQLIDVNGGRMMATATTTSTLRIADFTLRELPIALADAHVFRELGMADKPAMLLGMDALHLFERVSIDFAKRTARFRLPEDAEIAMH